MPQVTVRWLASDGTVQTGGQEELDKAKAAKTWRWCDVTDPDRELLTDLCDRFDLHPLAIEDVDHRQRRAKIDIYPSGTFVAWLTPVRRKGDGVATSELDVFIGCDYLITLRKGSNAAVDTVAGDAERTMKGGPDWTLHAIIDLLVDSALPLVDGIGEELDAIEESIISNPSTNQLARLHDVRRQLVKLHRIAAPERDILHALARERDVVSEDAYRYFLDVGDHIARLIDSIETWQDVGASVMDVFLSAQNNRMNEIMKQLTVVATIFMPLTLLSGIYGMNLIRGMWPPVESPWGFGAVTASMVVIAVAMMAWFRRKQWW